MEPTRYFYPRSPCGERRITGYFFDTMQIISIHALLAESDGTVAEVGCMYYISIHALLAESDLINEHRTDIDLTFLSTLSLRRATHKKAQSMYHNTISIHALLAESDNDVKMRMICSGIFLSTLSLRRATCDFASDPPGISKFLSTLSLRRATYEKKYKM